MIYSDWPDGGYFIGRCMEYWHKGKNTADIATLLNAREADVARAIIIGREHERKAKETE